MAQKRNPADVVRCSKCSAKLQRKNLEVHMQNIHGSGPRKVTVKTALVLAIGVGMLVLIVAAFSFQPRGTLTSTSVSYSSGGSLGSASANANAAPAFSLQDTESKPRTLEAYKGKVLLLNTMAGTWCPLCKRQMPELKTLRQTYGPRGVEVLTVNLDPTETAEQTEAYRQQYAGGLWPFAPDRDQVVVKYQIVDRTTTFIIDKEGAIKARMNGVTRASGIAPALDRVLAA